MAKCAYDKTRKCNNECSAFQNEDTPYCGRGRFWIWNLNASKKEK